eukprot:3000708-Rhodomonas_salina.1
MSSHWNLLAEQRGRQGPSSRHDVWNNGQEKSVDTVILSNAPLCAVGYSISHWEGAVTAARRVEGKSWAGCRTCRLRPAPWPSRLCVLCCSPALHALLRSC